MGVAQASVVGFLRTILIILVVYYVIKWITRLLLPLLFKRYVRKQSAGHESQAGKEGDVTIVKRGKKPTGKDDRLGDYVDFEEVD